jgi:hypothetical protein
MNYLCFVPSPGHLFHANIHTHSASGKSKSMAMFSNTSKKGAVRPVFPPKWPLQNFKNNFFLILENNPQSNFLEPINLQ